MSTSSTSKEENIPPCEEIEHLLTDSEDEQLPSGWEMRVTDDGKVFYVRLAHSITPLFHSIVALFIDLLLAATRTRREVVISRPMLHQLFNWNVAIITDKNRHLYIRI